MISLSLMILLISAIKIELTHTVDNVSFQALTEDAFHRLTLFTNQRVVAVVRVVCIAGLCRAAIANRAEIEFY